MDISNREDTFVEQYLPLENWGEGGVTDTESHLEKKHVGIVEPLHLMLASQTYLTHKHPASSVDKSDHQAYQALGTLHTTNPMCNTIREPPTPGNGSSPEYHPPIISERESILSLGVMGIPTVSLSEYVDDNPDSPIDESDSALDVDFQSTEGTTESAASRVTVSTPTLTASEDATSADSGDSKIKLVSPPDCKKPTNTTSISSVPAGATTSVQPTPPIQYSILREEREAELDSELVNESFDENPEKEHAALSPRGQKSKPWSAAASSIPSSVISSSTVETTLTEPLSSNIGSQFMNEKDTVEITSPTALANTGVRVEQPTVEDKVGKQRRGSQSRGFSVRRASMPIFLWGLEQQKAVDLLYWRDVKKTALLLSSMLLLLLSLTQFSVVSVGAYLALAILSTTVSFRIYKSVLQAVQKTDEGHPFRSYLEIDMTLSQEQMQKYAEGAQYYISCILKELCRLFLVQDLVDSLKFSVLMWLLTYVGTLFNGLTLLIMVVVSMFSMPVVYEKYQAQIDQYLGLIKTHVNCVVGKIQEKIPGAKRKTE
ncbi:reticulon-1-like [Scleropages formosus]|nr:reticulon-1-like [Scleropages formosus]